MTRQTIINWTVGLFILAAFAVVSEQDYQDMLAAQTGVAYVAK